MPPRADITGKRFRYCEAVSPLPSVKKKTRWNMRCDCGRLFPARTCDLVRADVVSCGCMRHLTRYRQPIKVPHDKCHPLVRAFWKRIVYEQTTAEEVADRAGIAANSIRAWRTQRNPRLPEFEAAVNVLGGRILIKWDAE